MKTFILILALIQFTLQIDHCLIEKSVCKKCKSGYYLSNGICSAIEHCKYFSNYDNTCEFCENGYRPNNGKTSCIQIGADHCYTYSEGDTSTCIKCQPGYKLKEDNTCELVVDHCQRDELDDDGNIICTYCQKGYAVNMATNECVAFPHCEEVDSDGKCIECDTDDNDYLHANQEGKCVIDFCEEYNEDGECTKCNDYFYLDDEGNCKYIEIPYCEKVVEDYKNVCKDTCYFLKEHDSEEYEIAKEEYLTRCNRKNEDGTCIECNYGGYEVDSTGKSWTLIGCEELEKPSSRCEYCEYGYILVDDETRCLSVSKALEDSGSKDSGASSINSISKLNILLILNLLFRF